MEKSKELDIKKENVNVGGKFSTVTKLYAALELPTKVKGNQKIAQDKEIARHLKYEPSGTNKRAKNEIVITEIYDTPLGKEDGRKTAPAGKRTNNGSNKYNEEFIPLLHDYISRVKKEDCIAKKHLIKLDILHDDYLEMRNPNIVKRVRDISDIKVTAVTMCDFHNLIFPTMSKSMKSALNRLCKDGKIVYREIMYVLNCDEKISHEANNVELSMIQDNEQFVLNELYEQGVIQKADKRAVRSKVAKIKYEKLLDDCLLEDNIKMCWKSINVEIIEPMILTDNERSAMISTLRNKFAKEAEFQAEKYKFIDPKRKEFIWGECSELDYVKPYNFDFSPYGYTKMQEVIKYFLMTDSKTKQRYIDILDDDTRELLELGICTEKDLFGV